MTERVIDAKDLILGRMATHVAKVALLGDTVAVVNAEKAVVTGSKDIIMKRYTQRRARGDPFSGPFYPRMPDRLVRRVIRGMLPYKKGRGLEAYKKVKCYVGVPEQFAQVEKETVTRAHVSKLSNIHYLSIERICQLLGAKTPQQKNV
ncbi:50S ribosomal protein L13 [Candidatus Woesearchaeota archaeon]|nr:50S ribosomal protein L13 [Candidatus Woesearchaeota archaeon]